MAHEPSDPVARCRVRCHPDGCLGFPARAGPPSAQAQPGTVDYARDIQPILEKYCYECHGRSKARARLRLNAPELIRKGGQSGPIVIPGKSHDSELMRRVLDENADDRMPLDEDPLPESTIAAAACVDRSGSADAGPGEWR